MLMFGRQKPGWNNEYRIHNLGRGRSDSDNNRRGRGRVGVSKWESCYRTGARMTQKIVVNRGYGGFSVHDDTVRWMRERDCPIADELTLPGETYSDGSKRDKDGLRDCTYPRRGDIRTCEHLIQAVEDGVASDLSICEVPDGVEWCITEYDGAETVREKHRTFPSGSVEDGIANNYDHD